MDDTFRYSIGEFSALTRISVRMLRHYDERGVLVPAEVDASSGYRRYAPAQVAAATRIRHLRDVGFSVSAIAALLALPDGPEFRHALQLQREALVADSRAVTRRLALLDDLLKDKGTIMTDIALTERTEPARTLATLRGHIPTYSDEPLLWQRFGPELQRQGLAVVGPCGCIEHDDEYTEHDPDISVFYEVAPDADVAEPLQRVEWPERRIVVARLEGPYDRIGEANARLGAYLAEHGLRLADHGYNRYLTDPAATPPERNVTEVCYPVA